MFEGACKKLHFGGAEPAAVVIRAGEGKRLIYETASA